MTAPKAMSSTTATDGNAILEAAMKVHKRQTERETAYAEEERALLNDSTKCWAAVSQAGALIRAYGIPASALSAYHSAARVARKAHRSKFPKNPNAKKGRK